MSVLATFFEYLLQNGTPSNAAKVLLAVMAYYTFKYRSHAIGTRRRLDLKQPKGAVPLLGHLPLLATVPMSELYDFFVKQYNELGPVWSISLPGLGRIVQIDTPENLEHVLKTNVANYPKGPLFLSLLANTFGHGVFTTEGPKWKPQRQIVVSVFNSRALRDYTTNVFVVEAKKVVEIFGKAADEGTVIDFQSVMLNFTMDSFGGAAFGKSFGCLENLDKVVPYAAAIDDLLENAANRLKNPLWRITEHLDGTRKHVLHSNHLFRSHAKEILDKRRKEGNHSGKSDFVQLFMDGRDDEGNGMSDDLIIDNIMTFMIAGRDSTAHALTWMFYLLLRDSTDKDIMAKLVSEVDELHRGADPTYESHKKQKYTDACLHEALRIFPVAPRNLRYCDNDDTLPDGTKVYKGEYVAWSSYVMGRSEALWGIDAKEYRPSRWINTEKPSPTKFNSFHAGPRVCPGQQFAINESLTIISMIFQSFNLELEDPSRVPAYRPSLAFPMIDGLNIRVTRRSKANAL
ncbi:hypothetical protein BGX27_011399 [Mortierella sp. AM989]|nr:hypothetical protein BGX27_011399 [Mortierella sp. AM989]